jgi:hypothetical protein
MVMDFSIFSRKKVRMDAMVKPSSKSLLQRIASPFHRFDAGPPVSKGAGTVADFARIYRGILKLFKRRKKDEQN